ncbi:MAG TPA: protease inhibitor I42 family protein [Verrucomicrobiae bacterium]
MKTKTHTFTSLFAIVCASFLLAGCAGMKTSTTTVTERDNGRDVQVAVGHVLVVKLPGNATTGYRWTASKTATESILQQLGDSTYAPDMAPPGMVGVGGTETFQFEARKAGQETLRLEYVRSWEKGVPPARTFAVNVTVTEK